VEPFDIANYYRINGHDIRRHQYNITRPEVFWRLDEACQHEARVRAQACGMPEFSYTFSQPWADHMQHAAAGKVQPAAVPAAPTLQLQVPVSAQGKWCEAVTAAEAVEEADKLARATCSRSLKQEASL
jgi:hypothetical protein